MIYLLYVRNREYFVAAQGYGYELSVLQTVSLIFSRIIKNATLRCAGFYELFTNDENKFL